LQNNRLWIKLGYLGVIFMILFGEYGVSDIQASSACTPSLQNPGLRNNDGSPHIIPAPHQKTGRTIDVTIFGADPNDNGKDDRPAIEQAIRSARPGDEVFFPNGVYNLYSRWSSDNDADIRLVSEINLRGESETKTILKTNLDNNPMQHGKSSNYNVIRGIAVCDFTITNLTITSTWNRKFTTDTKNNNPQAGGPTYGINLGTLVSTKLDAASKRIIIENVTVEKFRRGGIMVNFGCHDIILRNCTAQNATDLGGGGAGYGFIFQGKGHQTSNKNPYLGTIDDNYWNEIDSCKTFGPYIRHAALLEYWAHNNLVTYCQFQGTRLDAIDLHGEDEYNNEITENTVTGTADGAGIGIGNSGATHDRSGPANWIHHNRIDGCKKGITCEFGSNLEVIEDNEINNNTVFPNGCGIGLGATDGSIVQNNKIRHNKALGFQAIYLYCNPAENESDKGNPTNCTIIQNLASENTDDRIIRGPGILDEDWATNIIDSQ
jgi:large repetitive protein